MRVDVGVIGFHQLVEMCYIKCHGKVSHYRYWTILWVNHAKYGFQLAC